MIEVDRLMLEKYNINLFQMMENAGRSLAILGKELYLPDDLKNPKITILSGTGGNGGGGLVAGRRLANWGYKVIILLSKHYNDYKGIVSHQLDILKNMNVDIVEFSKYIEEFKSDLIIDALLGYNINGNPKLNTKKMIEWAMKRKKNDNTQIISLDLPSGIGPNGEVYDPAIKADSTLTLALPKVSMFKDESKPYFGELYLADISVPPMLYKSEKINLDVDFLFRKNDIIKICE
ncbi:MAG: Bifunctional NAD(P)H-hydrate repair enzyme Nnr [Candidatus Heimdallarchaeota archaeon LC_3]|nr:MAG: Bifunctional NAD(P)H-hydrate repair enzyme Nnr [Candidatus Heimdallarchaeota archaeon LC_3]